MPAAGGLAASSRLVRRLSGRHRPNAPLHRDHTPDLGLAMRLGAHRLLGEGACDCLDETIDLRLTRRPDRNGELAECIKTLPLLTAKRSPDLQVKVDDGLHLHIERRLQQSEGFAR